MSGTITMRKLNLLSDTFASVALEDIGACQYVIRRILGKDDIRIIDMKGQYRLLNLTAKDAILDAFAQDSTGRRIHYLKCEKGGYKEMCEVAEKIYDQGIEQGKEQGEMEKASVKSFLNGKNTPRTD